MFQDRGTIYMAGILALAAILFVAFPARVLECDAVIYACAGIHQDLIQSTDAGHLAWGGIEWVSASLGGRFSPPFNPIFLLRWLSVASALLGGFLLFRLLVSSLGISGELAAVLSGCLIFSYSYWHFGLQAEPHMLHTLVLIGFLKIAWDWFLKPGRGLALAAGFLLGIATLLHQTTILLVPVVLVAIWATAGSGGGSWRRTAIWFLGAFFVAAILPYLWVGWFVRDLRSVQEYREWIMGLSSWGYWGNWRWTSPVSAVVGVVRSLIGSHFLLGFGFIQDLAYRLFPRASWEDELMLARVVPTWLRFVLLPAMGFVLFGTTWVLVRGGRVLRVTWAPYPAFFRLLGGWLIVHAVFFTWWAPERAEFWIAFWMPLIVLLAPGAAKLRPDIRWLGLGLAGLIAVNLGGSIVPQASGKLEPGTLAAVSIDPLVEEGDVVVTDLPASSRAGRFVYVIDMIPLPDLPSRIPGMVDSLYQAVSERNCSLYWVSDRKEMPEAIAALVDTSQVVPARGGIFLIPFDGFPAGKQIPDTATEDR